MISAKPELLDDEEPPEEPRPPALVVPVAPDPLAALEPELDDDDATELLDPPETASPGEMLCTDTTVLVAGA
ncbi:MAG: hypothetical protein ACR2NR_16855 [Solirubrobacteraceae bacterium]